jgi:hypothetical protein
MVGTPITLDKVRHLRYTPNAIADIEEVLGQGFGTLLSSGTQTGVRHARAFLWGGLKHEDRRLQAPGGLERAGELIGTWYEHGGTLDTLYVRIMEALRNDGWLRPLSAEERQKIEADMGEAIGLDAEAGPET